MFFYFFFTFFTFLLFFTKTFSMALQTRTIHDAHSPLCHLEGQRPQRCGDLLQDLHQHQGLQLWTQGRIFFLRGFRALG